MWITGMKGMKEIKAKHHVIRFIPASKTQVAPVLRQNSGWLWNQ